jgi:sarcosine oxidase subunit gamma
MTAQRLSPLHDALAHLHPRWGEIGGMPVPLDYGDSEGERRQAETLALCDVSALARVVVKGPKAEALLQVQGVPVPKKIFQCEPLPQGGLIARMGGAEFFLEDGAEGDTVAKIETALGSGRPGVYRVLRQDASLLLSGSAATELLLETCGYDFHQAGPELVMTRVAGVSCAILPRTLNGFALFQLWADGTYGVYLWETLLDIAREMGGGAVGVNCFLDLEGAK